VLVNKFELSSLLSEKLSRMVFTLQELCYQRLSSTMMEAPPGLQEIIMGETKERMEARVREELWYKEMKDIGYVFGELVPIIMEDIINITVTPGTLRSNYTDMFPHVHPCIVKCAVKAAEEAVNRMEDRYLHTAFDTRNNIDSDFEDVDSEGVYM